MKREQDASSGSSSWSAHARGLVLSSFGRAVTEASAGMGMRDGWMNSVGAVPDAGFRYSSSAG
jgi:hypothetical protein